MIPKENKFVGNGIGAIPILTSKQKEIPSQFYKTAKKFFKNYNKIHKLKFF